ncbi:hypothetical protein AB0F93_31250, partial [Micromonospora tulbaghiae]
MARPRVAPVQRVALRRTLALLAPALVAALVAVAPAGAVAHPGPAGALPPRPGLAGPARRRSSCV